MELRHIRSFLSLAKTLNFSRTAEIVHFSQPALSLQIRALENEIGVKLFERDRRKTVLTAAGTAFQKEATGGFAQLEQAVQSARLAAKGKTRRCAARIRLYGRDPHGAQVDSEIPCGESTGGIFAAQRPYGRSRPDAGGRLARPRLFAYAVRRESRCRRGANSSRALCYGRTLIPSSGTKIRSTPSRNSKRDMRALRTRARPPLDFTTWC